MGEVGGWSEARGRARASYMTHGRERRRNGAWGFGLGIIGAGAKATSQLDFSVMLHVFHRKSSTILGVRNSKVNEATSRFPPFTLAILHSSPRTGAKRKNKQHTSNITI